MRLFKDFVDVRTPALAVSLIRLSVLLTGGYQFLLESSDRYLQLDSCIVLTQQQRLYP